MTFEDHVGSGERKNASLWPRCQRKPSGKETVNSGEANGRACLKVGEVCRAIVLKLGPEGP